MPEVLQFMQLLWRIVHGAEQRSKRMSVGLGITGPQRLVLRIVGLEPGISPGRLAATLHVHPSTLTGVLRRLERQRLLSRIPNRGDLRKVHLWLTPTGDRLNRSVRGTVEAAVQSALRGVSRRDRACTRRTLAAIADVVTIMA